LARKVALALASDLFDVLLLYLQTNLTYWEKATPGDRGPNCQIGRIFREIV
jgi:hypothetical protein